MLLLTLETFIATAAFKKNTALTCFSKFFYNLCSQLPFFIINITRIGCLMQDESDPSPTNPTDGYCHSQGVQI